MYEQDSTIPLSFLPSTSQEACTIRISHGNINYKIVKCQVIRVRSLMRLCVNGGEKKAKKIKNEMPCEQLKRLSLDDLNVEDG